MSPSLAVPRISTGASTMRIDPWLPSSWSMSVAVPLSSATISSFTSLTYCSALRAWDAAV